MLFQHPLNWTTNSIKKRLKLRLFGQLFGQHSGGYSGVGRWLPRLPPSPAPPAYTLAPMQFRRMQPSGAAAKRASAAVLLASAADAAELKGILRSISSALHNTDSHGTNVAPISKQNKTLNLHFLFGRANIRVTDGRYTTKGNFYRGV